MKRGFRARIALAAALVFVVWMRTAHADDDDDDDGIYSSEGMRAMFLVGATYVIEPLWPDIRIEFGDDIEGTRAVFGWPLFLGHVAVAERFAVSPFVEPQWVRSTDDARVLVGGRATLFAFGSQGLVVEGAARMGSDTDPGGTIGGGLMLWGRPPRGRTMPTVSIVYRLSMTPDGEPLHDVTLDLTTWSLFNLSRERSDD